MRCLSFLACWLAVLAVEGDAQITLGSAATFGVIAGTSFVNTGLTVVSGDIGVSPGSSVTGFPPGICIGKTLIAGAAAQPKLDALAAYNAIAALTATTTQPSPDLGGLTLGAGVYKFPDSAQITGSLTLDAQGDPNALFIFQISTTLMTSVAAEVLIINSGQACNVQWQVGTSATIGIGGNICW